MDAARRQFLDYLDAESGGADLIEGGPEPETPPRLTSSGRAAASPDWDPSVSVMSEIKEKMIGLQLRLTETEHDLDLTRQALAKARDQARDQIEDVKRDAADQVRRQRDEFEAVIKRQMAFSKKVLEEKEALAKRVDDLIQASAKRERQIAAQIQEIKDQERKTLQKMKAAMKAGEKARRDRLIEEMRDSIKEETVRALEPELQRILDSHSEERRRMVDQHDQALRQQSEAHQAALRRLRQQLEGDYQRQIEQEGHRLECIMGGAEPLYRP